MVSRPVGGVLSRSPSPGSPWVTIHLCGPPWDAPEGAERSVRIPCLTLLRVGVASCRDRSRHWCALTAPFHPCLCVGPETSAIGGLLSAARSDRSPRPGSRQHSDRWSPDLPRSVTVAGPTAATRPTHHHSKCGACRWRRQRAVGALVLPRGSHWPAAPDRTLETWAGEWRVPSVLRARSMFATVLLRSEDRAGRFGGCRGRCLDEIHSLEGGTRRLLVDRARCSVQNTVNK